MTERNGVTDRWSGVLALMGFPVLLVSYALPGPLVWNWTEREVPVTYTVTNASGQTEWVHGLMRVRPPWVESLYAPLQKIAKVPVLGLVVEHYVELVDGL